jgi:hypothetical protein
MAVSSNFLFSEITFLVAVCYLCKFTFLKSTQTNGSFDTRHDYILLKQKFRPLLKGPWHEVFDLCFFDQTTSPGSLIHRLKPFRIWLRIHEDNQQSWFHSGVNDTAVQPTFKKISSRVIWHMLFYKEIWLDCTRNSSVIDTAVTCTAV